MPGAVNGSSVEKPLFCSFNPVVVTSRTDSGKERLSQQAVNQIHVDCNVS